MSRFNPEFERNLWLELTRHRLIATPIVLALIFFLFTSTGMHGATLADITVGFYLAMMFLWGGHKAAEAVLEEINDNTWDFQRLSSQSPWSLSWAKLFGSTIYTWYTGLMLLGVYGWSLSNLPDDYPYSVPMSGLAIMEDIFRLILAALICHSVALLSSLQTAQDAMSTRGKLRIINHHVAGIIAGAFTMSFFRPHSGQSTSILWYGDYYNYHSFGLCLSVIFFLWVLLGINWQMRAQLQMRTGPLPWAGFVLYNMLLAAGFNYGMPALHEFELTQIHLGFYFAFCIGIFLFYFMLTVESWNGIKYRQLLETWRLKKHSETIYYVPRWLLTYVMAGAVGLLLMLTNASSHPGISWAAAAILCFALRDAGILHYFRLGTPGRRKQSTAMIYLVLLYGLLPWFLRVLWMPTLSHLFWPLPLWRDTPETLALVAISGAVQAAVVWLAVRGQWRKYWQSF